MTAIRRYKKVQSDFNLRATVGTSPTIAHVDETTADVQYDPAEYAGIDLTIDEVMVGYGYDLNLDATGITNPDGTVTLASVKKRWFFQIDRRTTELIVEGYTFGGKVFSLSPSAQASLLGIMATINDATLAPMLTWPINWNTKDDDDYLPIADAATFRMFFITALGTYRAWLDSGTALKDEVRAATTIAEVEAIVDPR